MWSDQPVRRRPERAQQTRPLGPSSFVTDRLCVSAEAADAELVSAGQQVGGVGVDPAPHPQAGGTGRNGPAAPRLHRRLGRPPVAGQSLTGQRSPSRARLRRAADAMAQAPPLTLIFSGKTSAPIRRTGEELS